MTAIPEDDRCLVMMTHPDKSEMRCALHRDHQRDDSDHVDEHGCHAPVLVSQATIREVAAVDAFLALEQRRREEPAPLRAARFFQQVARTALDMEALAVEPFTTMPEGAGFMIAIDGKPYMVLISPPALATYQPAPEHY